MKKNVTNIKHLNVYKFKPAKRLYIKNCPAVRVLSPSHPCSSMECIFTLNI